MDWKVLLSDGRFRKISDLKEFDGRDHFENDYSRLISSSFIRRLQDKTQVFPLHKSDFIRTRLTHSLEVSSIAKSLGKSVEKWLIDNNYITSNERGYLPSLLNTAGLIHDLGNPPYGHFGETAIQNYFKKYFKENPSTTLSEIEQNDLKEFDGNVQTFRILRRLQYLGDYESYNLCFATLATILKYPYDSITGNKKTDEKDIANKKFGYFNSEEKEYEKISKNLNLNHRRHPATFLLEAADDIAYSAADIEDGIKLGILDYTTIYDTFHQTIKDETTRINILSKLEKYKEEFKEFKSEKLNLIVTRFRIYTQGEMIQAVFQKFIECHNEILNGTYKEELLLTSSVQDIRRAYKNLSSIVFINKEVMQAELAGYEILYGLLDKFIPASHSKEFKDGGKGLEGRLFHMISSSLRHIYTKNNENYPNEEYRKYQLIVDFISGMTDTYALNYYHSIKGINY